MSGAADSADELQDQHEAAVGAEGETPACQAGTTSPTPKVQQPFPGMGVVAPGTQVNSIRKLHGGWIVLMQSTEPDQIPLCKLHPHTDTLLRPWRSQRCECKSNIGPPFPFFRISTAWRPLRH